MILTLQEKAYAKINLYLHVTGKRADGYHLLDSLVVFPDVGDELTLISQQTDQESLIRLEITGPFASQLSTGNHVDNLIVKAAYQLAKVVDRKLPAVTIQLKKNLPVASGIGGGSSDAAAALRLLMRYWNIQLPEHELLQIALQLGADIPVCLNPVTQRMQGIGEVISKKIDLPAFGMVLVNHGEALSTADVFNKRNQHFSQSASLKNNFTSIHSFIKDMFLLKNDLQEAAISVNETILKVLEEIQKLPHCQLARMSGSGATCFGLFETAEQAVLAADLLSKKYPWWVWGGKGIH